MWTFRHLENGVEIVWNGEDIPGCRFCGGDLVANNLKKMKIKDSDGHAADIECICPECRCLEIFGTAISKDEFDKLRCIEVP